uniref:Uncharacterized protein n=1 Tax=Rhizophora mucronata TaxID=61149 RepID=A0A2P2N2P7_RHIMU
MMSCWADIMSQIMIKDDHICIPLMDQLF